MQRYLKKQKDDGSPIFNILLFGAPGVGKGTYGKLITKQFDFKLFSMGEYFRDILKNKSDKQN